MLATGMLAIAAKKGIVEFRAKNPRDFTSDAHRTVDDSPFGGGAGMVMMAPPIVDAVESFERKPGSPVILMSPAGRRFDQAAAQRLAGKTSSPSSAGATKASTSG
jgi:tRNA (guanine37-N1)-methyltransferase